MTDRVEPGGSSPSGPLRTCIGCRQRAVDTDLLRVVAGPNGSAGLAISVVPDPRRRASGRGAWVHRDLACVDLAIRRRAFGRALHLPAPIDPAPVHEHVATTTGAGSTTERSTTERSTTVTHTQDTTSGTPQEMTSYGHSMKRQQ